MITIGFIKGFSREGFYYSNNIVERDRIIIVITLVLSKGFRGGIITLKGFSRGSYKYSNSIAE